MDRKKLLAVVTALVILVLMIYLTVLLIPVIKHLVANSDQFKAYLQSFGRWGVLVFIGLQILQVVIPAVPGEFIQFAGGYVFGIWPGTLYNVVGILVGSVIAFALARLVGLPLVRSLVPKKQLRRFEFIFGHHRAEVIVLVLFFIPGIPKDFLTYIAGLTPVRPLTFIFFTTIARFPANLAATYMGANLIGGNTTMVLVLVAAALVIFALGFFYRQNILNYLRTLK